MGMNDLEVVNYKVKNKKKAKTIDLDDDKENS